MLVAQAAIATPACPAGTGPTPHLGRYVAVPLVIGALIAIPLFISSVRHEKARVMKAALAIGVAGLALTIGVATFLLLLWRCVPL